MTEDLYTHGRSVSVGSLLERHAPIKSPACAKSSLSKEVIDVTLGDGTKCSDFSSTREASSTLVGSFQTVDSGGTLVSSRQRKLVKSCLGEFKPYVPAYICEPGAYQYPATDLNRLLEQFQGTISEQILAGHDPYAKTTAKLRRWRNKLEDPDDRAAVDRLLQSKLSLITLQRNLEGKFIDEHTFFRNPDNFDVFVNEIDNFFIRPSSTSSSLNSLSSSGNGSSSLNEPSSGLESPPGLDLESPPGSGSLGSLESSLSEPTTDSDNCDINSHSVVCSTDRFGSMIQTLSARLGRPKTRIS